MKDYTNSGLVVVTNSSLENMGEVMAFSLKEISPYDFAGEEGLKFRSQVGSRCRYIPFPLSFAIHNSIGYIVGLLGEEERSRGVEFSGISIREIVTFNGDRPINRPSEYIDSLLQKENPVFT